MLAIHDGTRDGTDTLQWKWRKGAITSKADFGNPLSTAGTQYRLCIYDGTARLILDAAIPAGGTCGGPRPRACWKRTAKGYEYYDKERTPDGIERVKLEKGDRAGKASIEVKGKGSLLDDPTFPIAQPVTAQLLQTNGPVCWESVHSGPPMKNGAGRSNEFKDKAD
jgi:hypothetical protein